jgi:hypothetical protein
MLILTVQSLNACQNGLYDFSLSATELTVPPNKFKTNVFVKLSDYRSDDFEQFLQEINQRLLVAFLKERKVSKDQLTKESKDWNKNNLLPTLLQSKDFFKY